MGVGASLPCDRSNTIPASPEPPTSTLIVSTVWTVPQVAPFTAWCAEQGRQPDSADARAEYGAHLAATADPSLIAWPPARNEPCWCGSGRKYKKCCAAPISADADLHR